MNPSDSKIILFSSFVAGALLIKKEIKFPELCNYMFEFDKKYDITMCEPFDDFDKLIEITSLEENSIKLSKDYSDLYLLDETTVYDYLYSLTNYEIREFFGIEEKEDVNIYYPENRVKKRNKSFFDMFKRTKIYAGS